MMVQVGLRYAGIAELFVEGRRGPAATGLLNLANRERRTI